MFIWLIQAIWENALYEAKINETSYLRYLDFGHYRIHGDILEVQVGIVFYYGLDDASRRCNRIVS